MEVIDGVLISVDVDDIKLLENNPEKFWRDIKTIGPYAFTHHSKLRTISIPSTVTKINKSAFSNCVNLETVFIPDTVTELGDSAFYHCKNLKNIIIPKSVKKMGFYVFDGCESLEEIEIPRSITEIPYFAFENCKNLKKVSIPDSVTQIGDSAFSSCQNLQEVYIPDSVKEIGKGIFFRCANLEIIHLSNSINKIPDNAFKECKKLQNLEIPNSVTEICFNAFYDCTSLKTLNIPDSVNILGSCCFCCCESLEQITLPDSINKIADGAFSYCKNLLSIEIPDSVTTISDQLFEECEKLENIHLPNTITKIGEYVFSGCRSLQNLVIPESVEAIGDDAFANCENIKTLTLPKNLKSLGDNAFYGCNLTRLEIPNSLEITLNTFFGYYFKFAYKEKRDGGNMILSSDEIKDDNLTKIKTDKILSAIVAEDDAETTDSSLILYFMRYENLFDKLNKNHVCLPLCYLKELVKEKAIEEFTEKSDFRFFKSEPILDLAGSFEYASEDIINFYKFMNAIGCFSGDKILDKNGRETEVIVGQKATSLVAQIVRANLLNPKRSETYFDLLSFKAKPNQDFLKFLGVTDKKNFTNLELLLRLTQDRPGLFARVIEYFDDVKKYRKTLDSSGKPAIVPWEEALKNFYSAKGYFGVTEESEDIAALYSKHSVSQNTFEYARDLRNEAEKNGVPSHILGKPLKEESILESIEKIKKQTDATLQDSKELIEELYAKQFSFEMLDKRDARNGIIGLICSCCATIEDDNASYGKHIAKATIQAKNVQNLIVKNYKGEMISKGTLYVNEKLGYGVFNDFELNEIYREHENKDEAGRYHGSPEEEETRELIFKAFMRGIQAFVQEYDKQHPDNLIKQINVGWDKNRLKNQCEKFQMATKNLTVPAEYNFEDAQETQYILYQRENLTKTGGKE